jgi:hypothetical protein
MAKQTFHLPGQLRQGRIQGFQARIDDDGALWSQPIQAEADSFSKPPLKAIADHGRAQGAWHGEADSWAGMRGISPRLADAKSREQGARETSTPVVNCSKIL